MKMKSVIKTNKDLKKNGYRIIRKLHKMEKTKGAKKAYKVVFEDTYMFILYCKGLTDIIELEYGETDEFVSSFNRKCEKFVKYLEQISVSKNKINKTYLAGFLKSYTKFLIKLSKKDIHFLLTKKYLKNGTLIV